MKSVCFTLLALLLFCAVSMSQNNPVPFLNQPLIPASIAPGGASFTLTVNGTGFVASSVVNWNGVPLSTTFVNSSQVAAAVPASDIAVASTATINVSSPAPGGGTSNVQYLPVAAPLASFALSQSTATVNLGGCDVPGFPGSAVADFNGDGKLDLVYGCFLSPNPGVIAISLGNGDGSFQPPQIYPGGVGTGIASGDYNGDGKLDFIAGGFLSPVFVENLYLGNGDGTFLSPVALNLNSTSVQIVAGDFNHDGKLDIASANSVLGGAVSAGVSISLGNGDGTFQGATTYDGSNSVESIISGDLDGDGNLDIVYSFPSQLSFLRGNGDGTFQLPAAVATAELNYLVAADLNGDGKLDLIGMLQGSGASTDVYVLLGNGDGTFQSPVVYGTIASPQSFAVGDFDSDGKLDVVMLVGDLTNPGAIYFLKGNGDGTLQNPSSIFTFTEVAFSLAVGDFTGEGKVDFASQITSSSESTSSIAILLQAAPVAAYTPSSLSFASENVGSTSAPQSVTLTNNGNVALTITGISTSGDFAETNNCGTSVSPGGSCQISVTFTPTATGNRTGVVSVADNAPGTPQTIALSGEGSSLGLQIPSGGTASATVAAGGTASYTLAIGGQGISGSAAVACTGAPSSTICSVNSSINVDGTTPSNFQVTVSTTARNSAVLQRDKLLWLGMSAGSMFAFVFALLSVPTVNKKGRKWAIRCVPLCLLSMVICSCGGGSSSSTSTGTPAGTYTLTINATMGSVTQSLPLTLIVQ
jgi:hypothetical protein